MPAPQKYLDQGLLVLHARVLAMFKKPDNKYHRCRMDNLYMSTRFCKACCKHPQKVLIHGVTRKSGRGLPDHIIQDKVTAAKDVAKVRNTTKAAVLKMILNVPAWLRYQYMIPSWFIFFI